MDGIDLYALVFQKHPDNSAMLLLYRHAYSAAIRSAHQLTDPKVQCFWCLLQPPSLALSRVGPLQSPDVLLVPPIESHPSCIGLVSIVILFRLHIVLLRDRSARRLRISKGLIDVVWCPATASENSSKRSTSHCSRVFTKSSN